MAEPTDEGRGGGQVDGRGGGVTGGLLVIPLTGGISPAADPGPRRWLSSEERSMGVAAVFRWVEDVGGRGGEDAPEVERPVEERGRHDNTQATGERKIAWEEDPGEKRGVCRIRKEREINQGEGEIKKKEMCTWLAGTGGVNHGGSTGTFGMDRVKSGGFRNTNLSETDRRTTGRAFVA